MTSAILVLMWFTTLSDAAPRPDVRAVPGAALPVNLELPRGLQPRVAILWQQSPTFRRQCARIAATTALRVSVRWGAPGERPRARALTTITVMPDGRLDAEVVIRDRQHVAELLAHEFEHVLEPVDGVDLARAVRNGVGGVRDVDGSHFETARAVEAGRRARREVASADRQGSR